MRKQAPGVAGTLTLPWPSAAASHPHGPVGCHAAGSFEAEPLFTPTDDGGKFLDVRFEHSDQLWPWSGFLALYIYVRPEGSAFNGTAAGEVSFTVVSPPMPGEAEDRNSLVKLPITVAVIPTPPRRAVTPDFHPFLLRGHQSMWISWLRAHHVAPPPTALSAPAAALGSGSSSRGVRRRLACALPVTHLPASTPWAAGCRERRVLWDQFHSLRYPPAYLPRDSLDVRNDILDWHGDHPHTNYHNMYDALRDAGYFLEVLGSPLSCFHASQVPGPAPCKSHCQLVPHSCADHHH